MKPPHALVLTLAAILAVMTTLISPQTAQAACEDKMSKNFIVIDGGYQTTYTARSGYITRVELLAGTSANAHVVVKDRPYDHHHTTFPKTVTMTFVQASQVTVTLFRQQPNNAPVMVALRIHDGCGAWSDFFGKGQGTPPPPPPPPAENVVQVPNGTTLQAGQIALVEHYDHSTGKLWIFGGKLRNDLPAEVRSPFLVKEGRSAWTGYANEASAKQKACTQAQSRRQVFPTYIITVVEDTGCTVAPPAERVTQVPDGQTVASGTLGRYEVTDYTLKRVWIAAGVSSKLFRTSPETSEGIFRAWSGYSSTQSAQNAAQTLKQQRENHPFYKNNGFVVTVVGFDQLPGYWLDRREVQDDETVPPGTVGVYEQLDFGRETSEIFGGKNQHPVTVGVIDTNGPVEQAVWVGYPDEQTAAQDALRHKKRREDNTWFDDSWQFTVTTTPP